MLTLEEIQEIIKPNYSKPDVIANARRILDMSIKEFDHFILKGIGYNPNSVTTNYEEYEDWRVELADYEVEEIVDGVKMKEFAANRVVSFLYKSKKLAGDIQVVLADLYAKNALYSFNVYNLEGPKRDILIQLVKDYYNLYNSQPNKNNPVPNIQSILSYVAKTLECNEETFDELALRCLTIECLKFYINNPHSKHNSF